MDLKMIDWQTGKTLPERMKYMLNNQLMCDVTFRVGPDQTPVQAHKFMLASASPVFDRMFNGSLAEEGEVIIPDITSKTFKVILGFIYTDDVHINDTNVKELSYGSDKYMIQVLKEKCSTFLSANINTENACLVMQIAHDLHIEDLKTEALALILKSGHTCLNTDSFLSMSSNCVKFLIQSDSLKCKEETIYDRIIEWAKAMCTEKQLSITDSNIKQELGELIYLIRFPVMKPEHFTENISNLKILTSDEKVNIYQSFHTKTSNLFSAKPRGNYLGKSTEFRRCVVDKNAGIWRQDGRDDCLDFRTNFRGLLSGFHIFGSRTYFGNHDVKVKVFKDSTVLGTTNTSLCSTYGQELYSVPLTMPIEVEENIIYSIQLNMVGPNAFQGKDYKTNINFGDVSVIFSSSSLPSPNGTGNNVGQLPGLLFDPL